jgi:hypothetical protein
MKLMSIPGLDERASLSFKVLAISQAGQVEFSVFGGSKVEHYVARTTEELGLAINAYSLLVTTEWTGLGTEAVPLMPVTAFQPAGVRVTVYDGETVETFDDLADADEFAGTTSTLVTFTVIGANGALRPTNAVGTLLSGGSAGMKPTVADYIEAVAEAEAMNDVTIILAPGVSDETFHAIMKDHCEKMAAIGKYRVALAGCGLDESEAQKLKRTSVMASERLCMVGDGLMMFDPFNGIKKIMPGSMAVCSIVGLLLSLPYYVSLTHKYLRNAYGVENKYDDAQHNVLHEGRMITFNLNNGVQIHDGITTSTKNAYEDLHMVRTFDVISRGVRRAMVRATGEANMPPTWGYVLGIVQKLLEGLKKVGAIMDFKVLNEVKVQDIVDRRFRLRIGVVPVFPVKYVEGYVDIVPPTFVEI